MDQVAASTVKEVLRLPGVANQILRAQRYRAEHGGLGTENPVLWAGVCASDWTRARGGR